MASCHSERSGVIFLSAGADHVICVEKTRTLNDKAAVLFSRTFYSIVFGSDKITICEAYNLAKDTVERKFGKKEADIMKLLVKTDHSCNSSESIRQTL